MFKAKLFKSFIYMSLIVNIFSCDKDGEKSLIQSRENHPSANSVTPKVIIFEDRSFESLKKEETSELKDPRLEPRYMLPAENLESQLSWKILKQHPVVFGSDLSGRTDVKSGPIFDFSAQIPYALWISYDLFRGPPPPGNWTLSIKLIGNYLFETDDDSKQLISPQLEIFCSTDNDVLQSENFGRDTRNNNKLSMLGLLNRLRPYRNPDVLDFSGPKREVIFPINISVQVEPKDVPGCSRVFVGYHIKRVWGSKTLDIKKFQFNQFELQMVYNGAYQEPERFFKDGNNGATYCANYCGSQVWNNSSKVGVCVSSEAEGRSFDCFQSAWPILGHETHQACICQKIKYETLYSPGATSCHRECLEMGKGLCLSANRDQVFLDCKDIHEDKTCVCASRF